MNWQRQRSTDGGPRLAKRAGAVCCLAVLAAWMTCACTGQKRGPFATVLPERIGGTAEVRVGEDQAARLAWFYIGERFDSRVYALVLVLRQSDRHLAFLVEHFLLTPRAELRGETALGSSSTQCRLWVTGGRPLGGMEPPGALACFDPDTRRFVTHAGWAVPIGTSLEQQLEWLDTWTFQGHIAPGVERASMPPWAKAGSGHVLLVAGYDPSAPEGPALQGLAP